jgi:hypothetical protein
MNGDRGRLPTPSGPVLKIAVGDGGAIFLDGVISSMPALIEALRTLKEHDGDVCIYRRPPVENPPAGTPEIFQAVANARLSIHFSSRPDFSDVVGPDGKLIPR